MTFHGTLTKHSCKWTEYTKGFPNCSWIQEVGSPSGEYLMTLIQADYNSAYYVDCMGNGCFVLRSVLVVL